MGRKRNTGADVPPTSVASGSGGAAIAPEDGAAALPPPAPPMDMMPSLPAGASAPSAAIQALLAANPALLLQNPLLAVQMLQSGLLNGANLPKALVPNVAPAMDADVQELCEHFHIEDRHTVRLNEIMKNRKDTFEGDMLKLWEKLEDAREPAGLLVVKMREMEEGKFIGKQKTDKELTDMVKKYGLDEICELRLSDILARFNPEKRTERYQELERHLEVSNRPSAMVMMLLRKLSEGLPLGKPGHPSPGSYLDRKSREDKEKAEKGRDRRGGDRDRRSRDRRSRDRDRSPKKDRGGDRDRDRRDRDRRSRDRKSRSRSRDRSRGRK